LLYTDITGLHENTIGTILKLKLNHDHFKNYYASQDEKKFIGNLVGQFCKGTFPFITDTTNTLALSSIIQTNGYPSPDNISIVYWRLGIKDIFGKLNAEMRGTPKGT
jgi:hypothetical protein